MGYALETNVHFPTDKGLNGYRRNVGLSVLAYNLHIIGNILKKQQIQKEEKSIEDKKFKIQKLKINNFPLLF